MSDYDTTWKVSAPEGGANPHFFVPERKKGYFESLAEQGFQNNLPSRVTRGYKHSQHRAD